MRAAPPESRARAGPYGESNRRPHLHERPRRRPPPVVHGLAVPSSRHVGRARSVAGPPLLLRFHAKEHQGVGFSSGGPGHSGN